jgi:haloalkane dehalogenase
MDVLRTPEIGPFPSYPWEPRYAQTSDGLRMAYVDEGTGPVVVLAHGEPSWGYLYRKMVPPLLEAGLRVVVPDLIGFGRSDKPAAMEDYTYARHVEWTRSVLFDALELTDVTLVCQDWGGLIGLRLVGEHPDRFAAVVAANTGLPDGTRRLPDAWWQFHDFVQRTPDLPIGFLVGSGCAEPLAEEDRLAYDAPFPDASYKAGPRAFPGLIPQDLDNPATPDNQRAWQGLAAFDRPVVCAFSDKDPITAGAEKGLIGRVAGTDGQPHTSIAGGGHFLQEDRPLELAAVVVDTVRRATG